jgi:hypothetical protein
LVALAEYTPTSMVLPEPEVNVTPRDQVAVPQVEGLTSE